ncbi:MAG: hypothetical protein WC492_03570 [Candidatus Micrarchaeia archaeon]
MLSNPKLFVSVLVISMLIAGVSFAGVADFNQKQKILIVNSQNYWDVIGGAVYAAQNGYDYVFVLTGAHAAYWINILSGTTSEVAYYQSTNPVYANMKQSIDSLSNSYIKTYESADLASLFASNSSGNWAIVVGKHSGAEAVSIAPYASVTNSSLYFAGKEDATSLVASLKAQGKNVFAYGCIVNYINKSAAPTRSLNSGSVYLDNVQILQEYSRVADASQIMITSGKTFEKSLVSTSYPIAIVGRTEPSGELIHWISSSGVRRGMIFDADANIEGSIASIKQETGLPIFVKLGEGFMGNAQMQPLAVMTLPSSDVLLKLGTLKYNSATNSFEIEVENIGNCNSYVRAALQSDDGKMSSSETITLSPGTKKMVIVPSYSSLKTATGKISGASFQFYSSSDPYIFESIDLVSFADVPVYCPNCSSAAPASANYFTPENNRNAFMQNTGSLIFSCTVALVLMLVAAYLFMHMGKKGGLVSLSRGSRAYEHAHSHGHEHAHSSAHNQSHRRRQE